MKKRIKAEIARLNVMLTKAEKLEESDNGTTAERYEAVANELQNAIDALGEALTAFD
jgi:hypothetical protein